MQRSRLNSLTSRGLEGAQKKKTPTESGWGFEVVVVGADPCSIHRNWERANTRYDYGEGCGRALTPITSPSPTATFRSLPNWFFRSIEDHFSAQRRQQPAILKKPLCSPFPSGSLPFPNLLPSVLWHRLLFESNRPRRFAMRYEALVAMGDVAAINFIDDMLADIYVAMKVGSVCHH